VQLPADVHDETLRLMMATNPRAVDHLLTSRTQLLTDSPPSVAQFSSSVPRCHTRPTAVISVRRFRHGVLFANWTTSHRTDSRSFRLLRPDDTDSARPAVELAATDSQVQRYSHHTIRPHNNKLSRMKIPTCSKLLWECSAVDCLLFRLSSTRFRPPDATKLDSF